MKTQTNETKKTSLTKLRVMYFIAIALSEVLMFCAAMQFASSAIAGAIPYSTFSYVLSFIVSILMFLLAFFLKILAYRYECKYRLLSVNHRIPFYFHIYQLIFIIPMIYPGMVYIWVYSSYFYGIYGLIISLIGLLIGLFMTIISTLYFLSTNSEKKDNYQRTVC